ncbi:MAG: DUF87 domain-containing protein [Desulfurococcaceae archaeon]
MRARRALKGLLELLAGDATIKVDAPDVSICRGGECTTTRYLIADEVEEGAMDISSTKAKEMVEAFASLLEKLPPGSEIVITKQETRLDDAKRWLANEMANLKAKIELAQDTHIAKKAEVRLRVLQDLYETVLRGKPVVRINLVVKLREAGKSPEEVRKSLEFTEAAVVGAFNALTGIRLRRPSNNDLWKLLAREAGLTDDRLPTILIDSHRLGILQPIPLRRRPKVEFERGLVLGTDLETGWPVILPPERLEKHVAVLGPTGRGKTTLLASIMESTISTQFYKVFAVDFKGDLDDLLGHADGLIVRLTPADVRLSLLRKPSWVSESSWNHLVMDSISVGLGVSPEKLSELLVGTSLFDGLENMKRGATFIPLVELLKDEDDYEDLERKFVEDALILSLKRRGHAFQNAYGVLLIGMFKEYVARVGLGNRRTLVVIDEAWRISRSRTLVELFKEGRSLGLSAVVATQSPGDLPREALENVHTFVIFGSPNENYLREVSGLLGAPPGLERALTRLGIGEAVLFNVAEPHYIVFRVRRPTTSEDK